jgi:putative flippase GtrA
VVKFYAVGGIGIGVQLLALFVFKRVLGWHYLLATALAVEMAVLHNFTWHQVWTWKDRPTEGWRPVAVRALRFNLTTGLTSILSNLVVMAAATGYLGVHYLVANAAAIAITAVVNYLVSDWFVFKPATPR